MPFIDTLPDAGRYVIQKKRGDVFLKPKFFDTKQAMMDYAAKAAPTDNVFHGIAGYGDDDTRKGTNTVAFRSFVLDVDTDENVPEDKRDPDNKFETKRAARDFILQKLKELQFPSPNHVIETSAGLHLYWKCDADIAPDVWRTIANRLKFFFKTHLGKAAVDTSRVSDLAGILRPPGVTITKAGRAPFTTRELYDRPQYTLKSIEDALDAASPAKPLKLPVTTLKLPNTTASKFIPNTLGGNGGDNYVDAQHMMTNCEAIKRYAANQGTAGYEAWRAVVALTAYTKQGEPLAQQLSAGHPKYDPVATRVKFDEALQNKQNGTAPIRCETLRGHLGMTQKDCANCPAATSTSASPVNCPLKAFIKQTLPGQTPLAAGVAITEGDIELAMNASTVYGLSAHKLPDWLLRENATKMGDFFIDSHGQLMMMQVNEKSENEADNEHSNDEVSTKETFINVASGAYWPIRQYNSGGQTMYAVAYTEPTKTGRTILTHSRVPLRDMHVEPKGVRGSIAGSIGLRWHAGARFDAALRHYMRKVSDHAATLSGSMSYDHFGWENPRTSSGTFVLGGLSITANGVGPAEVHGDAAAGHVLDKIQHKGTVVGVREIFSIFEHHATPIARFAMLSSLAAPLYAMSGVEGAGVWLHLEGPTSIGKSELTASMRSIWGIPTNLGNHAQDTKRARNSLFGVWRSIPIVIDEITMSKDEDLQDLAYVFSSGAVHSGNARSGTLRTNTSRWSSILATSANSPVVDIIKNRVGGEVLEAQLTRLIEIRLDEHPISGQIDPKSKLPWHKRARSLMDKNHGIAGPVFIHHIQSNRDKFSKLCRDTYNASTGADKNSSNRFHHALHAALITANRACNDLGFWSVTDAQISAEFDAIVAGYKSSIGRAVSKDLVRDLLQMYHGTIEIKDKAAGRIVRSPAGDRAANLYGLVDGMDLHYFIPHVRLREYAAKHKLNVKHILHGAPIVDANYSYRYDDTQPPVECCHVMYKQSVPMLVTPTDASVPLNPKLRADGV